MFINIPQSLKELANFFPENLYVVGGYVRNQILGVKDSDVDISSLVGVEEVENRLKNSKFSVKIKNEKFGACIISFGEEKFEYTSFRKERYCEGGGHCPVEVVKTNKIEEDAIRRDFTINAIYYNINKDEITDLFHGIIDLKQKIVRATCEEIFKSDGERILRMVRFAGELNFKIDKASFESAKNFVQNVGHISGVRRRKEFERILNCDKSYGLKISTLKRALRLLGSLGVWQVLGINAPHFSMTFKCDDRFLGFLIDIVDSNRPQCLQFFLENFLKTRFSISGEELDKIVLFLSGYYNALGGTQNKEYFINYFQDWQNIGKLVKAKSKSKFLKYDFFYKYILEHNLLIKVEDLQINKSDLKKLKVDERLFDRILKRLLSKVFDGKLQNKKSELLKEVKNLIEKD